MKILLDCCIPAKLKELKLPKIRTAEKLLNWLTAAVDQQTCWNVTAYRAVETDYSPISLSHVNSNI